MKPGVWFPRIWYGVNSIGCPLAAPSITVRTPLIVSLSVAVELTTPEGLIATAVMSKLPLKSFGKGHCHAPVVESLFANTTGTPSIDTLTILSGSVKPLIDTCSRIVCPSPLMPVSASSASPKVGVAGRWADTVNSRARDGAPASPNVLMGTA